MKSKILDEASINARINIVEDIEKLWIQLQEGSHFDNR
jgi:hypothetical protein